MLKKLAWLFQNHGQPLPGTVKAARSHNCRTSSSCPRRSPGRRRGLDVLLMLLVLLAPADGQTRLYTLNVNGSLHEVDQATGTTTEVLGNLGAASWSGLTASASEPNVLYAIHNPRPPRFEDPQFSQLARIDLASRTTKRFPVFDFAELGATDVFTYGIAVSPLDPNIAVLVGNDKGFDSTTFLWEVKVSDGSLVDAARPLSNVVRLESLTFGPDGGTLYGMNKDGELVIIDRASAEVSVVGDPGLTDFVTGIAFHPDTGTLFAIDGLREDRLVTLNPETGAQLSDIGPLGIQGPEGLAFLRSPFAELDCDQSGAVDVADLHCANAADITEPLLMELGLLPGDLDGLNGVNFDDFIVFAESFGRPRSKYTEGDIDNNGTVNFADYIIFARNFGRGRPTAAAGEAAVPEPSSCMLLLVGLLAFRWARGWRFS